MGWVCVYAKYIETYYSMYYFKEMFTGKLGRKGGRDRVSVCSKHSV